MRPLRLGGTAIHTTAKQRNPAAYPSKPQARKQVLVRFRSVCIQKPARGAWALTLVFLLTRCVTLGWLLSLKLSGRGDLDLFVSNIFQLREAVILDHLSGGLRNRAENLCLNIYRMK